MSQLLTCIDRLKKGAWTFVQLRGKSLGPVDINRGDVDLLGSPESIDRLVKEALCWSKEGLCHVHVRRRKGRKTEFSLFSRDGSERLLFDLWSRLPQIDQGKCSLTFLFAEHGTVCFAPTGSSMGTSDRAPDASKVETCGGVNGTAAIDEFRSGAREG